MRKNFLRSLGLVAVVVGITTLLGIRPMNSRTIEVTLGSASLLAGVALWLTTIRRKPAPRLTG